MGPPHWAPGKTCWQEQSRVTGSSVCPAWVYTIGARNRTHREKNKVSLKEGKKERKGKCDDVCDIVSCVQMFLAGAELVMTLLKLTAVLLPDTLGYTYLICIWWRDQNTQDVRCLDNLKKNNLKIFIFFFFYQASLKWEAFCRCELGNTVWHKEPKENQHQRTTKHLYTSTISILHKTLLVCFPQLFSDLASTPLRQIKSTQ